MYCKQVSDIYLVAEIKDKLGLLMKKSGKAVSELPELNRAYERWLGNIDNLRPISSLKYPFTHATAMMMLTVIARYNMYFTEPRTLTYEEWSKLQSWNKA